MGNICHKNTTTDEVLVPLEPPVAVEQAVSPVIEKPTIQVFALMRNSHEVIRGNVLDIQSFLDNGELDDAVESYGRLHKWMTMYQKMEEGNGDNQTPKGLFSIFDENSDGVVTEEKMRDDNVEPKGLFSILDKNVLGIGTEEKMRDGHVELDAIEVEMEEAIKTQDIDKIKEAFAKFTKVNETHLQKKEEIMMPKIKAMEKSGVNMKDLMVNEILALVVDSPDFKFFVQHANYILDKHHGGMPRVRVFDQTLWVLATPEQWRHWKVWIKGAVPATRFEEIMDATSL